MGFCADDRTGSAKRFCGGGSAEKQWRAVLVECADTTEERAGANEENGALAEGAGSNAGAAGSVTKNIKGSLAFEERD